MDGVDSRARIERCAWCGVDYADDMLLRSAGSGDRQCAACLVFAARSGELPAGALLEMRGAFVHALLAAAALPPPSPVLEAIRLPKGVRRAADVGAAGACRRCGWDVEIQGAPFCDGCVSIRPDCACGAGKRDWDADNLRYHARCAGCMKAA